TRLPLIIRLIASANPYVLLLLTHFVPLHASSRTEISTLSLHDALPISGKHPYADPLALAFAAFDQQAGDLTVVVEQRALDGVQRSEEHTSELQSRENLVCRLLLEKKKTRRTTQ